MIRYRLEWLFSRTLLCGDRAVLLVRDHGGGQAPAVPLRAGGERGARHLNQSDKISHIDTVIFHIDTVIFHIDTVILRSSSISILPSCHLVDMMTGSYLVTLRGHLNPRLLSQARTYDVARGGCSDVTYLFVQAGTFTIRPLYVESSA